MTSSFDRPAVERLLLCLALLAAVFISITLVAGPDGLFGGLLAAIMIAIAVVDYRRFIIPNELTGAAILAGLVRAWLLGPIGWQSALLSLAQAVAVTLPFLLLMLAYRYWRGRDGLGLGDVKLAAVAGVWLGWVTIFAVVEAATLSALFAYAVVALIKHRQLRATAFLPFGLFLAPAIWCGWLVEALLSQ